MLNVDEAAKRLGLKKSTLRAWILARRITYVKVGRRSVRIPAEAVEKFIADNTIPARERRDGQ